jgi:hypothetical protein
VGHRAGLDDVKKRKFLTVPRLEPLGRPTRSQSLYRLRYPGSFCSKYLIIYSWLLNDALSTDTVERRMIDGNGAVGEMIIGRRN